MKNIQKMNSDLMDRLIGRTEYQPTRREAREVAEELQQFGLAETPDVNSPVDLPMPSWYGNWDLMAHQAAKELTGVHTDRLEWLSGQPDMEVPGHPPRGKGWWVWTGPVLGWVRGMPPKGAVVLDFETLNFKGTWYPLCMGAYDGTQVFCWIADLDALLAGYPESLPASELRTLPGITETTIVGHNIQYDRAFLKEEYLTEPSGNRFFDTMSAHIACRGMCSQQTPAYRQFKKDGTWSEWAEETSTAGLDAVYSLHYPDYPALDKSTRNILMSETAIADVQDQQILDSIVLYCLRDIQATLQVFRKVWGELKLLQPHPASIAGQLLLGSSWLPLSADRWPGWVDRVDGWWSESRTSVRWELLQLAAEISLSGPEDNPQLETLDWSVGKKKLTESVLAVLKDLRVFENLTFTKAKTTPQRYLSGPRWFLKFLDNPSPKGRAMPLIIGVKWLGNPVLWDGELGWHVQTETGPEQLPHPERRGAKVSDITAKGFASDWAEENYTSELPGAKGMIAQMISTINWTSLRKRVMDLHVENLEGFPVVLPQLRVTGTITRRAADNTFQVMANPKAGRGGTEFKSMIEAPEGWVMGGADVDSEEAWLCGAMGDSVKGLCGSSPIGLVTLIGQNTKDLSTASDIHSVAARESDIDRETSKVLNYATMYGQGETGATTLLQRAHPEWPATLCRAKARDFGRMFKGKKSDISGKLAGGLASPAFNVMNTIADSPDPRTLILGVGMSRALAGKKDYKTTRINWTIQSMGVDFRDLWLLLCEWMFQKMGVRYRLLITIHDEIRFLWEEGDEVLGAWALQLAHLAVRAAVIDRMGLDCIPAGIAWCSGVDIDTVLRKDPFRDQVTITQPTPIAPGQCWSPSDLKVKLGEYFTSHPEQARLLE